jgi:putative ABC transport system permease protein
VNLISGLVADLRGGWRLLSRYKATSVLIVITLALGFGANVAIFAMGRGVLLRPLPYSDPDRLMLVWVGRSGPAARARGLATPRFLAEIQARQRTLSSVAAVELWDGNPSAAFDLSSSDGAERLHGAFVTPTFFQTLGIAASMGRTFTDGDPTDLVVISHELWQRLFGGSVDVLNRRIELATGRGKQRVVQSLSIVGVLPPRVQFTYPERTDVWRLLGPAELAGPLDAIRFRLVARLRPGVTLPQAEQDLESVGVAVATDRKFDVTFWPEPVHEYATGAARPAVLLLGGIAGLVFVVACLNVAALLLAQSVERRRDTAIHVALGASRWRIIRRLMAESSLLAIFAAVASVTVVAALQPLLRAVIPSTFPRIDEVGVDLVALAWTTALVTAGIVCSTIVPAWRSSEVDSAEEMARAGRSATQSRSTVRWRHSLVTIQVVIVVVMLVAGGLLLRSFWQLQQVDLGFSGERVFTAEMRLLDPRYLDPARLKSFQSELLTRVRALPGVEQASITSAVPLRGVDWTEGFLHRGERMAARRREVDPDYFAVMGIPVLSGRGFTAFDGESAAPVVVLSRALAARLFPAESPLGQTLALNPKNQAQVIGVVGDVRNARVEDDGDPAFYLPRAQRSSELICLVARTAPGTSDLAPAIRAIVASIDPLQPVFNATTMDRIAAETVADRRFYAFATAAFALVTLLLAAAGLFGLMSYTVIARTREIGVRIALGATQMRLVRMLIRQSVQPVAIGLGLGLVAAFWGVRLIERFLFQVRTVDALTYVGAAGWVLGITMLASLLPAVRGARMNPTTALRHE